MQVKFNNNYPSTIIKNKKSQQNKHPSFEMSMHADQFAKNTLLLRVENDIDWKLIDDLIMSQEKNDVAQIFLTSTPDSKKLSASIYVDGKEYRYAEAYLHNVRTWLRNLCEKADELTMEATKKEQNPAGILKKFK